MAVPLNPTPVPVTNVSAHTEQQQTKREGAKITTQEASLYGVVVTSFFAVIGWIAVHSLALKRERENREHADSRAKETSRAELLSSLKHWEKTLIVIMEPQRLAWNYYEKGAIAAIASAAEKFRVFVDDKETFDRLNEKASNMHPSELHGGGEPRNVICDAIKRFHAFIREA